VRNRLPGESVLARCLRLPFYTSPLLSTSEPIIDMIDILCIWRVNSFVYKYLCKFYHSSMQLSYPRVLAVLDQLRKYICTYILALVNHANILLRIPISLIKALTCISQVNLSTFYIFTYNVPQTSLT
jgi:hypothetical protein